MSYFEGIKVGQEVWESSMGTVQVTQVMKDGLYISFTHYLVFCDFNGVLSGRKLQTVFWSEVKITPPPRPKRMVTKETDGEVKWLTNHKTYIITVSNDLREGSKIKITWQEEET